MNAPAPVQHLEVPIRGMTCAACSARIERVLNRMPGVRAAVNLAAEKARIDFDPAQAVPAQLVSAIEKAGYAVPEQEAQFALRGMTCAACASRIEKTLNDLPSVTANVNLATERARLRYRSAHVSIEAMLAAIQRAGYEATLLTEAMRADEKRDREAALKKETRNVLIGLALAAPFLVQMFGMITGAHHDLLPRWLQFTLATPIQFWLGRRFYVGAWHSLRGGGANMDVLIALGTSMAYGYSVIVTLLNRNDLHVYFEAAAMVVALVMLGKLFEAKAKQSAAASIEHLLNMQPRTARVREGAEVRDVDVSSVRPGDIVIIRPGESVAVDGVVVQGSSTLIESMLTGESTPAIKQVGDKVFAATRNQHGTLEIRAERVGTQTQLARIIRLVEDAQGSKAPVQRLADRISGIFVPIVLALALLTFIGWWLIAGSLSEALINAVAVLVIACPCALGLATPAAIIVGSGRGAQLGVVFKNAVAFEHAARISALAFDKTGTLTLGQPMLDGVYPASGHDDASVLRIAASLESGSEHPLGEAIRTAAKARNIALLHAANVTTMPGLGLCGEIGGTPAWLGSPKFAATQASAEQIAALPQDNLGKTVVVVGTAHQVLGYLTLSDPLRPSAADSIRQLRDMKIDLHLISGDNANVAHAVAHSLGIEHVHAPTLPESKAAVVGSLKSEHSVIGMVGDGINDAPALAAADVGFAVGSGTDVAIETADITLLHNSITGVVDAIQLSKATLSKVRQNLFFAFVYNVLGIPLAAMGLLSPVVAGAAMALSSVSVVSNALLLKRWRPQR